MTLATHLGIDASLCGTVTDLSPGWAVVRLVTLPVMAADEMGLVHGGFVFGAADFAAMAAVNDPFVVLAGAECKFLKPVQVGQTVTLTAQVTSREGRKSLVDVVAECESLPIFRATFKCAVLDRHVLES